MNELELSQYLGRIGIYNEGSLKCKVQVTGVAIQESNFYHFEMTIIGKVRRAGKFMTLAEAELKADASFGGAFSNIILAKEYISVTYIGNLKFSQEVIAEFEQEEAENYL